MSILEALAVAAFLCLVVAPILAGILVNKLANKEWW